RVAAAVPRDAWCRAADRRSRAVRRLPLAVGAAAPLSGHRARGEGHPRSCRGRRRDRRPDRRARAGRARRGAAFGHRAHLPPSAVRLVRAVGGPMTQPPGSAARDAEPLIVLGEVRSCLLPTSTALSRPMVQDLLTLVPGRRVPARDRPIPIAQSATTAVGVDCDLAIERGNGRDPRAIGTVAVQAVVVGGRILQSSARTQVVVAQQKRHREWSHYLSRVGMVEVVTRTAPDIAHRLAEGYLAGETPAHTLDLASIF